MLPSTPAAAAPAAEPISPPESVQQTAVQQVAVRQMAPGALQALPKSNLQPRPGKRLKHTKPATFRLPIELIEALKEVAAHNNLNMTDIVAEAVWLHLGNFAWPSGQEVTRDLLAAHFFAPTRV